VYIYEAAPKRVKIASKTTQKDYGSLRSKIYERMKTLSNGSAKSIEERLKLENSVAEQQMKEIVKIQNNTNMLGTSNPHYIPYYLRDKKTRGSGEVTEEEYQRFVEETTVAEQHQADIDAKKKNRKQVCPFE